MSYPFSPFSPGNNMYSKDYSEHIQQLEREVDIAKHDMDFAHHRLVEAAEQGYIRDIYDLRHEWREKTKVYREAHKEYMKEYNKLWKKILTIEIQDKDTSKD